MKATKIKRRTAIRKVSIRRKVQNIEYAMLKDSFLQSHPRCVGVCKGDAATDVHHLRGRSGKLFLAVKFWVPLCRNCHEWVHNNMAAARDMGLLCEKGKWGVYP